MYVCTYVRLRMRASIYLFIIYYVYVLVRVLTGDENLGENTEVR